MIHYIVVTAHQAHHLHHLYGWAITHLHGRSWAVYPGFKP